MRSANLPRSTHPGKPLHVGRCTHERPSGWLCRRVRSARDAEAVSGEHVPLATMVADTLGVMTGSAVKKRAVRLHRYGGPEALVLEEVPTPRCGPNDVKVRVRAAGVNPVDFKFRDGSQRAIVWLRFPWTLGMDVSGEVLEVGARVTTFRVGDEVMASPSHRRMGCYADEVVVRAAEVAPKPKRLTHEQAGGFSLAALTAWAALVTHAKLKAGQRVLVQAGAGGVGSLAIQLARHLGAEVFATCSARNVDLVRSLGATPIDYGREDYRVVAAGCDVVLDTLGGEHHWRAVETVREGGRVVTITPGLPEYTQQHGPLIGLVRFAGSFAALVLRAWWRRRVRVSLATRWAEGARLRALGQLADEGALTPLVDRSFPLTQAADAHRYLETGRARGKVVLLP